MITVTLAMSLPAAAPSGPPLLAGSQRNGVVRCTTGYSPRAARQPLLLVALPAEGLSPTAGGGHSPRSASLRRASSPSPSASAVQVDPRLPEQWIGGALQLPHQRIDPPPRDQPALAPRLPQPAGQPHKLVELRRAADRHPFRPELFELHWADAGGQTGHRHTRHAHRRRGLRSTTILAAAALVGVAAFGAGGGEETAALSGVRFGGLSMARR